MIDWIAFAITSVIGLLLLAAYFPRNKDTIFAIVCLCVLLFFSIGGVIKVLVTLRELNW
jgi:hypothetical protein